MVEMASVKIIQVLTHSVPPELAFDSSFYEGGWHFRVAKELATRSNRFQIECWRPQVKFEKIFTGKNKNGILIKIFPSFILNFHLKSIEISLPLLVNLYKEIRRNKEIIIHIHGLYNFMTYLICLFLGKRVPIVVQSHGGHPALISFNNIFHPLKRIYFLIKHVIQVASFRKISYILVLNKNEKEILSMLLGPGKVEILPMGINFNLFKPMNKDEARKRLGLDLNKKYLLYVGRLLETKGLKYLLLGLKYALKEVPDLQLILIGEGPYKYELKKMSQILGIEKNISFKGLISHEKLPLYYNAADIFVFPSLGEGWGMAPLEALACGRPVISTDVGCIPRVAKNVGGVLIVPKRNGLAIKEAIIKLLKRANCAGEINFEELREYSWDKVIMRTIAIYEEIIELRNKKMLNAKQRKKGI